MFNCKSKKHWWLDKTDADQCCNGYRRVLLVGDIPPGATNIILVEGIPCGRTWVPMPTKGQEHEPTTQQPAS